MSVLFRAKFSICCIIAVFVYSHFSVVSLSAMLQSGDVISKMHAELGEPLAQFEREGVTIYSYPQGMVHVSEGVIVEISEEFYKKIDQISRESSDGVIEVVLDDESEEVTETYLLSNGIGTVVSEENDSVEVEVSDNEDPWFMELDTAQKQATELERPLFMLFTASDTEPDSMKLDTILLQDGKFEKFAAKQMVLFRIEFPNRNPSLSNATVQNEALRRKWIVERFPTIVIALHDGTELGRLVYVDESIDNYIKKIKSIIHSKTKQTKVETPEPGQAEVKSTSPGDTTGKETHEADGTLGGAEAFLGEIFKKFPFLKDHSESPFLLSGQILVAGVLIIILIKRLFKHG